MDHLTAINSRLAGTINIRRKRSTTQLAKSTTLEGKKGNRIITRKHSSGDLQLLGVRPVSDDFGSKSVASSDIRWTLESEEETAFSKDVYYEDSLEQVESGSDCDEPGFLIRHKPLPLPKSIKDKRLNFVEHSRKYRASLPSLGRIDEHGSVAASNQFNLSVDIDSMSTNVNCHTELNASWGRKPRYSLADWAFETGDELTKSCTASSTSRASVPNIRKGNDHFLVEFFCGEQPSTSKEKDSIGTSADCEAETVGRDVEAVLALGNVTAGAALEGVLDKRGLTIDKVNMFLEGSSTPLPANSPAYFLGGRKLFVKVKDSNASTIDTGRKSKKRDSLVPSDMFEELPSRKSSTHSVASSSGASTARKSSFMLSSRKKDAPKLTVHPGPPNPTIVAVSNGQPPPTPLLNGTTTVEGHNDAQDNDSVTVTTVTVGHDTLTGTKRSRIGMFFGKEKTEMLSRLQAFVDQGITSNTCLQAHLQYVLPTLEIEEHWTSIVNSHQTLHRKQAEQQEALWELVKTEENYIRLLSQLSDVDHYLFRLQSEGFLKDIEPKVVFHNIAEVYQTNLQFWNDSIKPLLAEARKTGLPLDPRHLESGFSQIDQWCKSYIMFNLEYERMHSFVQRKQKEHELFKEFVLWVQSLESARRLKLEDLLASPMQRLTKYHLLLKAVLKSTTDPDTRELLTRMIEKAEDAAGRLNFELSHKQQYDMLVKVMQSIESYDGVDPANEEMETFVKSRGRSVDLTSPMPFCRNKMMRRLWLRGDLKLRDGYVKTETTCYLFTDMFLVCKQIGKRGDRPRLRIIRPPYFIERVIVKSLTDSVGFAFLYLNEFDVPSAAYVFQTSTPDEALKWLEIFHMARQEYRRCQEAQDMLSLSRDRSSADLLTPGYNSVERSGAHNPHRRVSVGAIFELAKPFSVKKDGGLTADARSNSVIISHRKCSSMDSTVVAQAATKEKNRSVDDSVLRSSSCKETKSTAEQPPIETKNNLSLKHSIKDSHSAINLSQPIDDEDRKDLNNIRPETPPIDEPSLRPRCNSSGLRLDQLVPLVKDGSDRALSPVDLVKGRSDSEPSTVLSEQIDSVNEKIHLSPNAIQRRESTSPIRKRLPSPVFFKRKLLSRDDLTDLHDPSSTDNDTPTDPTEPFGLKNSKPYKKRFESVKARSMEGCQTGRRFERRYFTADAIENMKPKQTLPPGILKRFSWNISQAMGGQKRTAITPNLTSLSSGTRKNSNSTVSSESFSSSTSGVSSSGSQLYLNDQPISEERTSRDQSPSNISTVPVNEHHSKLNDSNDQRTLCISLSATTDTTESPPPLPDNPPPSCLPTIAMEAPSPPRLSPDLDICPALEITDASIDLDDVTPVAEPNEEPKFPEVFEELNLIEFGPEETDGNNEALPQPPRKHSNSAPPEVLRMLENEVCNKVKEMSEMCLNDKDNYQMQQSNPNLAFETKPLPTTKQDLLRLIMDSGLETSDV